MRDANGMTAKDVDCGAHEGGWRTLMNIDWVVLLRKEVLKRSFTSISSAMTSVRGVSEEIVFF